MHGYATGRRLRSVPGLSPPDCPDLAVCVFARSVVARVARVANAERTLPSRTIYASRDDARPY